MGVDTNTALAQIFGAHDIGVEAYQDAAMVESAMKENWNRGDWHSPAL